MDGGEAMAVIGIGATSRVTREDVLRVITAAKLKTQPPLQITAVATLDRPQINATLARAAEDAGLEFLALPLSALLAVSDRCATRSAKSLKHYGIPSVAEAAALAAAGHAAELLVVRFCRRNTTASIASAP
jgi:cobalamin biosynthesis protein CbiG